MKKLLKYDFLEEDVDLTGQIDDVIFRLKEYQTTYNKYLQLEIIHQYYGYDGGHVANLHGTREETDAEYKKRKTKEKEIKDAKAAKKLKRIEQIKKEAAKLGLKVTN